MNCKYNVFPKLIECRKRLFMSQRELAEAAGIPVETYKKA
nr:MAG TPA: Regulatory protein [Caudoviricetes sp.]